MTIKKLNHEEFFFKKENKTLPLYMVADYAKRNEGDYEYYRGHMFCAECKKARLNLIQLKSGKVSYLRQYPNEEHEEDCLLQTPPVLREDVEKIFKSVSKVKIQNLLHSMLVEEIKKNNGKGLEVERKTATKITTNPFIIKRKTNHGSKANRLSKKLFSNDLKYQEDKDFIYAFYGKVKLEVEEKVSKQGKPYNKLYIKVKKDSDWIKVASVYRDKAIIDAIHSDKEYYLVVVGSLDPNWEGQINLINKDQSALRYIEAK